MSTEAMKQAVVALDDAWGYGSQRLDDKLTNAITSLRQAIAQAEKQVVFKIYKPTLPRGAIPNVRDAELPWVYDQDPSSGNVASMWVTPVKYTPQPQREWVGLMRGVRVEGDTVVITAKGGNEAARQLCAELLKEKNT